MYDNINKSRPRLPTKADINTVAAATNTVFSVIESQIPPLSYLGYQIKSIRKDAANP